MGQAAISHRAAIHSAIIVIPPQKFLREVRQIMPLKAAKCLAGRGWRDDDEALPAGDRRTGNSAA